MIQMMYKKPTLLNKEDTSLTISELTNYKHARNLHAIAISAEESGEAAKHYPVFFVKGAEGISPIALLGIKENENMFVTKQGKWATDKYIPSIIRTYPFVLSRVGESDQYSIAYDAEYEGLNKADGQAIFKEDQELTEYGENVVKFVENVYKGLEITKPAMGVMDSMELFKPVDATVEKDGQKYVVNGLMQVDTEKLNTLGDEDVLKLAKSGSLRVVYTHLDSLSNLNKLASKLS